MEIDPPQLYRPALWGSDFNPEEAEESCLHDFSRHSAGGRAVYHDACRPGWSCREEGGRCALFRILPSPVWGDCDSYPVQRGWGSDSYPVQWGVGALIPTQWGSPPSPVGGGSDSYPVQWEGGLRLLPSPLGEGVAPAGRGGVYAGNKNWRYCPLSD